MRLRKTARMTLAVLLTATGGGMAWGHPVLEGSDPGQGGTVSPPIDPTDIYRKPDGQVLGIDNQGSERAPDRDGQPFR